MAITGIKELKRRSGAELDRLLMATRPNLGTQKKTKLKSALGRRAKSTLLDDSVAKTHAERLSERFNMRWGGLTKKQELARLRFLTVLGSVVMLDVDAIGRSIKDLESEMLRVLVGEYGNVDIIGAWEIEVVNLKVLIQIAAADDEREQRKLEVLTDMMHGKNADESVALVHIHAVVDLGEDAAAKHERLVAVLQASFAGKWRVELKQTFEKSTLRKNLRHIASYMTKGGNDTLRYNARFGRDDADELDHRMWRAGGFGDKKRPKGDPEGALVEDNRSLALGEIKVLGEALDKLMARNGKRDGYLFTFGARQRG